MSRFAVVSLFLLCTTSSGSSQYPYHDSESKLDDLDTAEAIFQSQSSLCSESDDLQKIQCFREIPLAEYEVFEGEDVLMRCRVAYQKGKLQWAFKGKMLGFDRNIPNHPRMRLPGDPAIGDHSLFIENVNVSDSGNYECQLSPSASQPPRRRMTELLVLRPPNHPSIYKDSEVVKGTLVISIKKEEIPVNVSLTCVSLHGNPNPTFLWTINDNKLESIALFRSIRTQIYQINETSSMMHLRSDQLSDNDIISCGVFNRATKKLQNVSERIIFSKVTVVKRVLPGKLRFKEIPSKTKTTIVQEKEQFRLSCITSDPGDPPIRLSWSSTFTNYPITDFIISDDHNKIFSESTVIIPSIDKRWHSQSITCNGTQDGKSAAKSISITIMVKHWPEKLDLAVWSLVTNHTIHNPSIVYHTRNQAINVECFSSPYYGEKVAINWYTKTVTQTKWKKVRSTSDNVVEIEDRKLRVLKSVITISKELFPKDHSNLLMVSCVMQSPDSLKMIRKEVTLEEYIQSTSPIITVNDERNAAILKNGQSTKIRCTVAGGHPTPGLKLIDEKNRQIDGRIYDNQGISSLEVIILVTQHDHGNKLRCVTFSKVTLDFLPLSSDFVTLTVAMPPQQLSMVVAESGSGYRAMQNISYSCVTDSSFPEAIIEWRWYHSCNAHNIKRLRISRLSSSNIRQFCELEILQDSPISTFNPSTLSTISTTTIKLTPAHDFTYIECRVLPNIKWTYFASELSKIVQINVQYMPMFPREMKKIYNIEEGRNISIKINARANPQINGFTWLLNQQTMTRKSQIDLKIDQFSVEKAQPDMMGNYTLLLENQLGKAGFSFFLNVTFPPKLLGPSIETITQTQGSEYRQRFVIMCSAQANPFKEQVRVQWTRDTSLVMAHGDLVEALRGGGIFSESSRVHCAKDHWSRGNVSINCISLGAIEIVSSLQIMTMDYRYIGAYKCIFSSDVKSTSAMKTTNLLLPTLPVPIQNYRRSEYAAKIGRKTDIVCYFVSFPVPTVEWTRPINKRCIGDTMKYVTSISSPQTGLIKAVLAIIDTNNSDIGTYTCKARNRHGTSSQTVTLDWPRSPAQPMNVTIVNITDTKITLGWILGFNGGSKQTIQLQWKQSDNTVQGSVELEEEETRDVQFYRINDLQSDQEYEILIHSTNRYTIDLNNPTRLSVRTMKFESEKEITQIEDRRNIISGSKGRNVQEKTYSNNILIIILLSAIGGLLICLKIGLVVYFFRKRKYKQKMSVDKFSNPTSLRLKDGYPNSADSMEMRAPSLIRSCHDSSIQAHSVSDQISQNGSEIFLKTNFYKTIPDDLQSSFMSPDVDLVASAIGRNNYSGNGCTPSLFHSAYVQQRESSPLTGYPEPLVTGYYGNRAPYNHHIHNQISIHQSSPLNYYRPYDGIYYPTSVLSVSTASGDSNRSRSPNRKLRKCLPQIGQSRAPSTVEEYLSCTNSGSEDYYNRFRSTNVNEEYPLHPMSSFRINPKTDYSESSPDQVSMNFNNEILFNNIDDIHCPMVNDRRIVFHRSKTDQKDQKFDYPVGDYSLRSHANSDVPNLNYVDLLPHSSPSVIRMTGAVSDNL